MGSCFSSESDQSQSHLLPQAQVVSVNGTLRHYNVPVLVSQVLQAEAASSIHKNADSFILCHSDSLSYDDYPPALDSNALLAPDHLYFVLPKSKLLNKFTASDMAALAVKASLALHNASSNSKSRRNKSRISPVFYSDQSHKKTTTVLRDQPPSPAPAPSLAGFSRSGSVRKLQKYTSRRAKLAVRSFRLRLSTIYEGTVLPTQLLSSY